MEFNHLVADDSNWNLEDNDEQIFPPQNDNFIDDNSAQEEDESPSFFRFVNQTGDLDEALNYDDQSHLDSRDLQPEMFLTESRENVEFDEFNKTDKFQKTLCNFKDRDVKDSFLDAILFGLLFQSSGGKNETREPVDETMGKEFVTKLFSDKWFVQLVDSFESFFEKCHLINDLAEEKGYFWMVYRRRDKFRYFIKKDVHGKNNVLKDFSACVIQKSQGYEISWQKLKRKQKCFLEPIDIVYELVKENENIRCYFASDLALTYRTCYSQKVRGKEVISNLGARQY